MEDVYSWRGQPCSSTAERLHGTYSPPSPPGHTSQPPEDAGWCMHTQQACAQYIRHADAVYSSPQRVEERVSLSFCAHVCISSSAAALTASSRQLDGGWRANSSWARAAADVCRASRNTKAKVFSQIKSHWLWLGSQLLVMRAVEHLPVAMARTGSFWDNFLGGFLQGETRRGLLPKLWEGRGGGKTPYTLFSICW